MEHLDSGVPVIRGEHINIDGTISHDWANYWYVSESQSQKYPKTIVKTGDLIMSVRGSVGKIGVIDEKLSGAQVSPNCIRISLDKRQCDARYFMHYFKSFAGQNSILESINATTIQTIKASSISATYLPLPHLAEQERIVERIESLLTRLDAGVAALKHAQAALKRYRASVLKAACEGRLVAQDGQDEPASVLLERIRGEKRAGMNPAPTGTGSSSVGAPLVGALPEGLPDLPAGWAWATLETLASPEPNSITDGPFGSKLKTEHYTDHGARVIRLQNIGDGDFRNEKLARFKTERTELYKLNTKR